MSTQPNILESGTLLLDRYRIKQAQKKDSISQFFWALDTRFDDMKVLSRAIRNSFSAEMVTHLFPQAAQIGAILGHQSPHILQILNYGIFNDQVPFYILESAESTTLKTLLSSQSLSTVRFLSLMQQVCVGLASAHGGVFKDGESIPVVHGDLKPTNILVFADSGLGEISKIMGFGLKDFLAGDAPKRFIGTPAYSAPEHFEGKTSPSSDIYSLGVMLFLGLTGDLPIKATEPTLKHWHHAHRQTAPRKIQEVAPTLLLPPALQTLVFRCLAKNPQERPQDAMEIFEILKDCLFELNPESDSNFLRQPKTSINLNHSLPKPVNLASQPMAVSFS